MCARVKKRKIAVVTSAKVGKPPLLLLENAATVAYSTDCGLEEALRDAQAVFLWDVDCIDQLQNHWEWMSDVEWMHAAVAGVDMLCFKEMCNSDITLTNAGNIYNYAIAEYVTGAVIAHERNYPRLYTQMAKKQWKPFVSSGAQGKNALIVGPGRIGRACARSLATLGMHVRGIGRHTFESDPDFERIDSFKDLDGCIGWAHHLIVTAPLTPETYHLIDAEAFRFCRSSVHLINVGRGPIVSTNDLVTALQQGRIGGATLDVFETEPLDPLSPLWKMTSVMITPHIAGEIEDFEDALISQFVENAQHWLRGEPLDCIVDKNLGYSAS